VSAALGHEERAELLARYAAAAGEFEAAIADVRDDELDARPIPGEWSVREIAHHVCDSEMTSAIRLRRLIAEDDPAITGYDEMEWSRRLHYPERPIGPSVAAMRGARDTTLSILECLTEDEWARAGTHSEIGTYSVERWLRIYAEHPREHGEQARRVLEALRGGRG
jgi:hypothetical protein